MISCKHEHLGEGMVVNDPSSARMHRVWWLSCMSFSFQTFNFVLIVAVYHIYSLYLKPSKVEAGKSITWLPLFGIVWLYNFAVLVNYGQLADRPTVCLTSNKLYCIEDQLADVSTQFHTSASWTVGELTGYRVGYHTVTCNIII